MNLMHIYHFLFDEINLRIGFVVFLKRGTMVDVVEYIPLLETGSHV